MPLNLSNSASPRLASAPARDRSAALHTLRMTCGVSRVCVLASAMPFERT